ncbi:TetR family transcriptional regulator [Parasphingopyxis marina]|uniref:TetR family transcriptional regulator n=1 Tax=Parasphingopyxis marina TaxID=2761622 RepID=A0A842HX75_9SPHN|nr:TetR family transcriptional regulator [Parasphingopyxis marina]MBC2778748.1 TetR family transcriptional regulator [Parasphingopyxis marina]
MSFSKLDQPLIVAEALALLQDEGLAKVGIRRLAARLDVSASSLYWHVQDKTALLSLMSSTVFRSCLDAVPPCDDWREWLRGFGLAIWDAQKRVRDAHLLIRAVPTSPPGSSVIHAEIEGKLVDLGLDPVVADLAQRSVQSLATGWTTLLRNPDADIAEERALFERALDTLIGGWTVEIQAKPA